MKSLLHTILLCLFCLNLLQSQDVISQNHPRLAIGLNLGLAINDADVDGILREGRTLSTSIIRPLGMHFSVMASYEYTRTRGFENHGLFHFIQPDDYWIPAYENKGHSLDLMVNYDYRIPTTRFTLGIGLGGGLSTSKTSLNYLNSDSITYYESTGEVRYHVDELRQSTCGVVGYEYVVVNYDETYETQGVQKKGLFRVSDNEFLFTVPLGLQLMAEVTDRLKLGVSYLMRVSDNDYIDGVKFRQL